MVHGGALLGTILHASLTLAWCAEPVLPEIKGRITGEKVTAVLSEYLNKKLPMYRFPRRNPHLDWISPKDAYRIRVDGQLKDDTLWGKEIPIVGWWFEVQSNGKVIDLGFAYSM